MWTSDGPTLELSPLTVARLIDQAHEDWLRRRLAALELENAELRGRLRLFDPTFNMSEGRRES